MIWAASKTVGPLRYARQIDAGDYHIIGSTTEILCVWAQQVTLAPDAIGGP